MKTLEEIEAQKMRQAQARQQDPNNDDDQGDPPEGEDASDDASEDHDDGAPTELEQAQQELEQMKQQMAALQGRLTPAQQQGEEFRRLYQEEHTQRSTEREQLNSRIAELEEKLNTASASANLEELLTEEERDLIDPDQLKIMAKVADSIARRSMPKTDVRAETLKVLEERQAQKVKAYREKYLTDPQRGLADLSFLADDPKFKKWLSKEENDDFDPLVNSFLSATSEDEISRLGKALARRVAKYKGEKKAKPNQGKPDSNTKPRRLQRNPSTVSDQDMAEKLAQAKSLSRSRNPEDRAKAKALLEGMG